MNNPKKRNMSNGVLNVLLIGLVLVMGLGIVPMFLGAVNTDLQGTWYGFRPYIVLSDSMEDTIMTGALLIGRVTPFEALEVGDVVSFDQNFDGEVMLNTHRIIEINETGDRITTQGDNSEFPDDMPVTQMNFRYRVVLIWNGAAQLGTLRGMLLYIVLPIGVLVLLIVGVATFVGKRKKKASATPPLPLRPQMQQQMPMQEQYVQMQEQQMQPQQWQPVQPQAEQWPVYAQPAPPPQHEQEWQVPPAPAQYAQEGQEQMQMPKQESKFARWKQEQQQALEQQGYAQPQPQMAYAGVQQMPPMQLPQYPQQAPAPVQEDDEDELLCLIDAAINPKEDLELLIDTVLCRKKQHDEKEDHEWFNHLMRQKGIAIR